MKHTCGAWYIRCETCGKKNICPSCEATRADAWSPMCERCEGQRLNKPKVTKEVPVTELLPNLPQQSPNDLRTTFSLGVSMIKHVTNELGYCVRVRQGNGFATWTKPKGNVISLGIKYVRDAVELDDGEPPHLYSTETYLWRGIDWTPQKRMWYVAIHEAAHIYNYREFKGRQHDNNFKRSVEELQTLFPYDEVMEAVQ